MLPFAPFLTPEIFLPTSPFLPPTSFPSPAYAPSPCPLQVTDETNLASSSLVETGTANDLLGVIVSYSIKVAVILSQACPLWIFWGRNISYEPKNLSVQLPQQLSSPCPIFHMTQKFVQITQKFVRRGNNSPAAEEIFTQ